MQLIPSLGQKQKQSLVMTPQLQQAIKLLQLGHLEMAEELRKELEENPFLENQSTEEESEINDEVTNDLSDSIDSGEYLTDEPKNEDYENSYESDYLSNSFKNNVGNNETLDPGSIAEQTISELAQRGVNPIDAKVGILGITF